MYYFIKDLFLRHSSLDEMVFISLIFLPKLICLKFSLVPDFPDLIPELKAQIKKKKKAKRITLICQQ